MTYYLTVNGETETHDNEMSFYLKIEKLRKIGFTITYTNKDQSDCHATKGTV